MKIQIGDIVTIKNGADRGRYLLPHRKIKVKIIGEIEDMADGSTRFTAISIPEECLIQSEYIYRDFEIEEILNATPPKRKGTYIGKWNRQ